MHTFFTLLRAGLLLFVALCCFNLNAWGFQVVPLNGERLEMEVPVVDAPGVGASGVGAPGMEVPGVDALEVAPPNTATAAINHLLARAQLPLVPSGYLKAHGVGFVDIDPYNGTLQDSNVVFATTWRLLQATLHTAACNVQAQPLPNPATLNAQLRNNYGPDTLVLLGLHWQYHRLHPQSLDSGWAWLEQEQLVVPAGNAPKVFQGATALALTTHQHYLPNNRAVLLLKPDFWLSNVGGPLPNISVDLGTGQGFEPLTWGQPFNVFYTTQGLKTLTWRVQTGVDGGGQPTYAYSHSQLMVPQNHEVVALQYAQQPDTTLRLPLTQVPGVAFPQFYNGLWTSANVQIAWGAGNTSGHLRRPLIVLEGFDAWHVLSPNDPQQNYEFEDFRRDILRANILNIGDELREVLQDAGYDLVFVDWALGMDYIQEHAYLTAHLLEWINADKALGGSTEPNVLLGYSMGGLIGRYALAAMEQQPFYTNRGVQHQVRLFVSIDAPHQGAVLPLGAMAATQHLATTQVSSLYPYPRSFPLSRFLVPLRNAQTVYNSHAARQMLRYRYVGSQRHGLHIDSAEHVAFKQELQALGYPQQSRNVALSNGSECGRGQPNSPGQNLVNIQGQANVNPRPLLLLLSLPPIGLSPLVTTHIKLYELGNVPLIALVPTVLSSYEISANMALNLMHSPGSTAPVYNADLKITKCLLGRVFCLEQSFTKPYYQAPANLPRYMQAPGGSIDQSFVNSPVGNAIETQLDVLGLQANLRGLLALPTLNFVPTVSALDIQRGTNLPLTTADLYRAYSPSQPLAPGLSSPFANFITGSRDNEAHIASTNLNATWLWQEVNQAPQTFNCLNWCQATLAIQAPDTLCPGQTFTATVTGLPGNEQVIWNRNPQQFALQGNINQGNPVTITPQVSGGQIQVSVIINGFCGGANLSKSIFVASEQVAIQRLGSSPVGVGHNNTLDYCAGSSITLQVTEPLLAPDLQTVWQVPCGQVLQQQGSSALIQWQSSPCSGTLQVNTRNACGQTGPTFSMPVQINACGNILTPEGPADGIGIIALGTRAPQPLLLRPNPTPTGAHLQIILPQTVNTQALSQAYLYIYNSQGHKVMQRPWPKGRRRWRIRLAQLPAGVYWVRLQSPQGMHQARWLKQ